MHKQMLTTHYFLCSREAVVLPRRDTAGLNNKQRIHMRDSILFVAALFVLYGGGLYSY